MVSHYITCNHLNYLYQYRFQESNSNVAATFYWLPLRRQVRIEGVVTKVSREESEEYFHQRPRASQVCDKTKTLDRNSVNSAGYVFNLFRSGL